MIKDVSKILVVDLEATCWEKGVEPPGEKKEIIQIGWAWLDLATLAVSEKGQVLVKPQQSKISEYCVNLTGITPKMAKRGIPYQHACKHLIKTLGGRSRPWAAWGGDKKMLDEQCAAMQAEFPFSDAHINLQLVMAVFSGEKHPRPGFEKVMAKLGLEPCGPPHRADNDAWDTAVVLSKMIESFRRPASPASASLDVG